MPAEAGLPGSDVLAGRVSPDLVAWRRDRNVFLGPSHHVLLDTDLDFLHTLFSPYRAVAQPRVFVEDPARLCNFLARHRAKPTNMCRRYRAQRRRLSFGMAGPP